MKILQNPIFLIASLCLFFPIGIFLLIFSEHTKRNKIIMASIGCIMFIALLSTAFIGLPKVETLTEIDLVITRDRLTVGQSGGFSVHAGDRLITAFEVTADNDNLQIHDNVYTAQKIGSTTLHIRAGDLEETVVIEIVEGPATDTIVYLSPTASRFHRTQTHAGNNAIAMTEEEALHSAKTPCKICYKEKADG